MAEENYWNQLAKYPAKYTSNFITINGNQLISAPTKHGAIQSKKIKGLLTFNPQKNDWEEFIQYPDGFETSSHSLTFNSIQKELYLFGFEGNLLKIDLNTTTSTVYNTTATPGSYPGTFFINDQFHYIAHNHHSYDPDANTFKLINFFAEQVIHKQVLYSARRNMLYLFGRTDTEFVIWTCGTNADDAEYNWKKHKALAVLQDCWECAVTLVNDEKYAIILEDTSRNIYVMDMDTLIIKESEIKLPQQCHGAVGVACCIDEKKKCDVLISGFMRRFLDGYILTEILKMIEEYCCEDYIHLIYKRVGDHWRMPLHNILNDT